MSNTQNVSITKDRLKFAEPPMHNVVFLNDDVTTVQFVEYVLMHHFGKSKKQAEQIVDQINNTDRAIVGTYYLDIAKTKANLVIELARENNFPFQVITEEV